MSAKVHGAFICARYSTDNQNPDSIEVQVEKCTAWCIEHGIPVLDVFADEAVSGMKDNRPRYNEMMRQLRLGMADTVVIYDQSRMFRKMVAWFAFRDEMAALGVTVVSVTQPMIGKDLRDPTNFLTEGSMALFNQIWALQTRQKVMEKMAFMARNGQHTGGTAPLGYSIEDGRLVVCEKEAEIVRRIFHSYAEGKTYKAIIDDLNANGIKTKFGNSFGSNSLHDLLHNEKYIGVLTYGKAPRRSNGTRNSHANMEDILRIENAVPAIVEKDVFDTVQRRLAQNKRRSGGRPPQAREYPLKGKVFCGECGSSMTISVSKQRYYYYACTGKKRLHICDAAPISADELENIVADIVRSIFSQSQQIDSLMTILRDEVQRTQGSAVGRLQALLADQKDINSQLDNAVNAVLNGLSSPALNKKIAELEEQKSKIERDLLELKAAVDSTTIPEERLREIVSTALGSMNADTAALLSVVYRVEVRKDTITVWTILDADPNGDIDVTQDGVTITPGATPPAPTVFVTPSFVKIVVARREASQ